MNWALLITILFVASPAAISGGEHESRGVRAGILVHAEPKVVYSVIRYQRKEDPSGVTELSESEFESLIKEDFDNLPIIGHASCIYRESYTPYKTVDYKMIKSDKLKAFEGFWELKSENEGKDTYLQLSSYVDTGLPIPFGRQITNVQTIKDVRQRLQFVKAYAEKGSSLARN